jgi:hypothetical protein
MLAMQPFRSTLLPLVVLAQHAVLSLAEMSFTEPPVDQGDFYRTYYLGQTVNVAWNESSGLWPTVNLRIGPAFMWSTSYAVLLSTHRLSLFVSQSLYQPDIKTRQRTKSRRL